jgi:hypothetical protein
VVQLVLKIDEAIISFLGESDISEDGTDADLSEIVDLVEENPYAGLDVHGQELAGGSGSELELRESAEVAAEVQGEAFHRQEVVPVGRHLHFHAFGVIFVVFGFQSVVEAKLLELRLA